MRVPSPTQRTSEIGNIYQSYNKNSWRDVNNKDQPDGDNNQTIDKMAEERTNRVCTLRSKVNKVLMYAELRPPGTREGQDREKEQVPSRSMRGSNPGASG